MASIAYISIGANLGDRLESIEKAIALIDESAGSVLLQSSIYATEPVGFEASQDFLNLCITVETDKSPVELIGVLKNIEIQLGRHKKSLNGVYESRLIDLDIILFDNAIVSTSDLSIPHERYRERMFVLKPLNEIAPEIIDPIDGKTIKQLYAECFDQSTIKIHEDHFRSNE